MISSLPGPLLTMVIGNPICSSMNSTYFLQFSGSSSKLRIPRISHFQPGSFFSTGFSLFQLVGNRKSVVNFTVDLIPYTYRDLLQISQCIQYGKCYIGSALQTTAVLGGNTVEPAHTSGASGGSAELTAVTAAVAKLICFVTEDLGYESTCSYGRVCLLTVTICLIS